MDRLIDGANEKSLEVTDVEKETFLRLVEFAYRGDYTVQLCPGSGDIAQQPTAPPTRTEDQTGSTLTTRWTSRQYLTQPTPRETIATRFSVIPHREFEAGHEAIFLLHAKLHCLAKRYEVIALEELTLHKLHETLKHCGTTEFVSREARVADIVALANCAYETDGASDALRKEVLEFVVILLNQLDGKMPGYERLLSSLVKANNNFVVKMVMLREKQASLTQENAVVSMPEPVTPEHAGQRPPTPAHTPTPSLQRSMTSGLAPVTPVQDGATGPATPMQTSTSPAQRPAASGQAPGTPTRQASVHGRHTSTLDPRAPSYQPRK